MFSETLMDKMRSVRDRMPSPDLLDPVVFFTNLKMTYHTSLATESLLQLAALSSRGKLMDYMVKKHLEEKGHADWLKDDLEQSGFTVGDPDIISMAFAGSQYYLIKHVSPVTLVGYAAALECFPTSLAVVDLLESAHGRIAMRTVRYHAEHDVDHGKELLDFIDQCSPADQKHITLGAMTATEWTARANTYIAAKGK